MPFNEETLRTFVDLAEKMGTVATEIKEVRKEVHNINTSLNEKVTLLIEANQIKEEEQDTKIAGIGTLLKELEPSIKALEPLSNIMLRKKLVLSVVALVVAIFSAAGGGLTQLIINKINDTTGVSELNRIVKKNSETLNRLINYLHLEREVQ